MARLLFSLALIVCLPAAVLAQGDLQAERSSLADLTAIATDITVEGPAHLADSDLLRTDVLLHRIVHRIREAGIDVERISPGTAERPPHLHIHLNLLELDRGLVPFSISADFYQDVRLARNRTEMSAITWDESVLGLVTRDLLSAIPESVDNLVDQFAADFLAANRR